jgi:hypothetical protein
VPSEHWALAPQGDGLHRSTTVGAMVGGKSAQLVKGSPVYPSRHVHAGTWFATKQLAFAPQEPGQGSLHLRLMQASFVPHSAWMVHSGRQLGG